MPGRFRGATRINARAIGSQNIIKRYKGDTLIWQTSRIFENFQLPDQDLWQTGEWTDLGPSTDHKAAIINGMVRLEILDGFLIIQSWRSSRARYNVQHGSDDGFIEVRPGTKGNGTPPLFSVDTYTTDVFRRANNSGSTHTHGVGIRMRESRLFIVRRVSGTDSEVVDCGSFGVNDKLRLKQVGNLHSMYRNGSFVGEWNDSGASAAKGASYRSVVLRVDASKPLLGNRRFSPAIDILEAS